MKRYLSAIVFTLIYTLIYADFVPVKDFIYVGPIPIVDFAAVGDTTGLTSTIKPLEIYIKPDFKTQGAKIQIDSIAPGYDQSPALHLAAFDIENRQFAKTSIAVGGLKNYKVYCDDKELSGATAKLLPGTHRITVKWMSTPECEEEITVDIDDDGGKVQIVTDGQRMITLDDVIFGTRITGARISPKGNYYMVGYSDTSAGGRSRYYQKLYDARSARPIATLWESAKWLPRTEKYYVSRNDYEHGRHIVTVDPASGDEEIITTHLPDGTFIFSPTEDYIVFGLTRKGKAEDPDIYQILEPDDRQPGWRDRTYPAIYRLNQPSALQPLALGVRDIETLDISDDGSRLLLRTAKSRLTERPTTLYSLITMDIATMRLDTIVADDGFISDAYFSPTAEKVIVTASPEAFGRIGCVLPDSVVPSTYDYQLFMVDMADKSVKPLTRDFNPSINSSLWSRADGMIYITATDKDKYTLYSLSPKTGEIRLVPTADNVIRGISAAVSSPTMLVWGQSDSNPDRIYALNTKNGKSKLLDMPSDERLEDVRLSHMEDWTFINSRGDTVYCRYYLPDNFDPERKYPMIVNYYGGCTPSTRLFESRYPMHVYASLGYVMLQITPSGATGFGQEWSSRHVSTAGKGVAEDIIEGTLKFCEENPYVDTEKIGCIGASYGGFMTQYLQTLTDIFAAAVSHAGISDHTSFWGEGFWGYSYSETSMGRDLPWTNPDLYVKQSPLYNAHKIHTPILFLHGDSDTNVPVGESIQMYTALKRLGVETALVQVAGQNHHINDIEKRKKWQNTIFAWFARFLQDDDSWWLEMYE